MPLFFQLNYPNQQRQCNRLWLRVRQDELPQDEDQAGGHNLRNRHETYDRVHAEVVHSGRTGHIKTRFDLAQIHHELRVALTQSTIQNTTRNVAVAAISFVIKINDIYDEVHFNLRIPGFETHNQTGCFNFSDLEIEGSYEQLSQLYQHGLTFCHGHQHHGHRPNYANPGGVGVDQYIRHSEQYLAVWLSRPETARYLINRVTSVLRARHQDIPFGATVKFSTVGLHIHSAKTSCAVCETVLLGMANSYRSPDIQSLCENLQGCIIENEEGFDANFNGVDVPGVYYSYSYPGLNKENHPANRTGIRMFVTYTADIHDADHPAQTARRALLPNNPHPAKSELQVNALRNIANRPSSERIWIANFARRLPETMINTTNGGVGGVSVLTSGTNTTPDIDKIKRKHGESAAREDVYPGYGEGASRLIFW